ncbi:CDP-alcohol phosphatidyltransferase (plasmid) [Dinoroseobacter shibae DFL 12 = DSM 16493]|uniref:CDP-alcohol phosphatidyltransferase n=1 Tax=Dinoroseobacter shibae (strain DSM 16493 / NCIMB 14021 / DFL 12) TaxID=398580 RepID=A8LUG1_DINSH|nr:CDP-alcohol phosphatidyltransferase [Dinoroseobacter shibae DFL 12 = DSM 16493]
MGLADLPLRRRLPRVPVPGTGGPEDAFALAALLLAALTGLGAALLPGAGPLSVGLALAAFGTGAVIAGRDLRRAYPHGRLGLCNLVTLGRLALTSALLVPLVAGIGAAWPIFAVAGVALALDGVDGWLARKQGLASAFGARFDVEVDAALALILAVNAATGPAGLAAALLGLPRYLFVLAARGLPWMRRDLPERFSRKTVCVLQMGVLIALQAPVLPAALALPLVGLALAALAWSFAVDLRWLWRKRAA